MKLKKKIIEFLAMEMAMKESKVVPDFGFQIFLSRNLKRLENELEQVKKEGEASDEFKTKMQEFEKLRSGLAKKDDNGEPIIISDEQGQRYDVEDLTKFEKETTAFWEDVKNKKIKEKHEKKMDKYRKHIQESEIEIDLVTFSMKSVPSEFFNEKNNMRVLLQVADLMEELFTD